MKKKAAREKPPRKTKQENPLNSRLKFDSFVVGSSNNFAHAAAVAVAQAPAKAYNPLFIYGATGLGKTHLMQAIGHHVLDTSRMTACYVSCESMMNEYIAAIQNQGIVQFRKKYRNADLLLIDDIHFLAGKERLQEEFFHTFNTLFDAHKQIVMTSDRPASEIMGLERRLVSRFEWGLVTELEAPDLETRIAFLQKKQSHSEVKLPAEIINFIAENISSNFRKLEGAIVRTISYISLSGRDIAIDALKHLLRDALEQEKKREITFDVIQRTVAEHFDVRLADMSSKQRSRSVAFPRQIAMYLCRRFTSSSLPAIAMAFGKTHATVVHACNTINNRLESDQDLRVSLDEITRKMSQKKG